MKKSGLLLSAGFVAIAASALASAPVRAQTQGAGGQDLSNSNDIIVTATRRASPLSDVPIAVSAVTAQSLQNTGANDIRQLNQLAPSLLVSSTGTEANGSARIRGVGTVGDNPGLESSVAVFIDGVYRSRTGAGLNELGEIERVEVLRGPQGTLFGRNASAGLLNIVTKAPDFTFGGNGEVTYGNYDYWRLAGRVTGPVAESLALSLDGVYVKRDGFYTLVDPAGKKVGDTNNRNRYFFRAQALYEPSDALSVRLIGDYTHRNESCCGAVYIDTSEKFDPTPGVPGDHALNPTNRIVTILQRMGAVFPDGNDPYQRKISITPGYDYQSKLNDWGVSGEVNYDFGKAKLTSITAYRDYKSTDTGDVDYNTVDIIHRAPDGAFRSFKTFTQELRLQGTALKDRLDWLIGGYYAHEKLELQDNLQFGSQYGPFAACRALAGSAAQPSGLMPYLDPSQSGCLNPVGRLIVQGALPGTTPAFGPFTPLFLSALDRLSQVRNVGDNTANYFQKSENYAFFTHNIFHVTSKLDVTIGLRYTHESKDFHAAFNNTNIYCPAQQAALGPLLANPAVPAALRAAAGGIITLTCQGNSSSTLNALTLPDSFGKGQLSGTGVISYKPTNNALVYASYSKGYKSGGYNLDRSPLGGANGVFSPRSDADAAGLRFAPEKVDAYEVGIKYNIHGFDVNIAGFREEFENFQLNTFNGTVFVVQNINGCKSALAPNGTCAGGDVKPGVISQGVELEMGFRPGRTVRASAGLTYADTHYARRLVGSSDGSVPLDPALFVIPGKQISNAPKIVATASFTWTPDIGSRGLSGLFYVDTRMTGDYNTGSDLFPEKEQDGYAVVNARVGLRGKDQKWAIELWAQNLFDAQYTQVAFNTPFQGSGTVAGVIAGVTPSAQQLYSAFLAEPRTYGLTLRGKF